MWTEQSHSHFQQLRRRQEEGALTEVEQAQLALLLQEVEAAEAGYLIPATERLRQEHEFVDTQNRTLEDLVLRKQALASRLHDFLAHTQAERRAIEGELAAVLVGSRGPADR